MSQPKNSNFVGTQVGAAVKAARKEHGMTLVELAGKSGLSTGMISKIERGAASASLSSLEGLANAIGIPIINFFGSTAEYTDISFIKSGGGVTISRFGGTYEHDYKLLGKIEKGGMEIEAHLVTLSDPDEKIPLFHQPGNLEFVQVISGAMKYRCGGQVYDLSPGDCLTFEGGAPHSPVELVTLPVVFLNVIAKQS